MNLEKMLEMQSFLDAHIRKEKGLEDQDLVANTFVALQTEMAEFANEGRWFKHWSNNREPKLFTRDWNIVKDVPVKNVFDTVLDSEINYAIVEIVERKPLLEEFVDGIHFFLSIALQKGWEDALYIYEEQLDTENWDGGLSEWYLEMTYFINKSYFENHGKEFDDRWKKNYGFPAKQYWFRMAWIFFLNIGVRGFGFTLDQIEQAYFSKNKINYQRQEAGY